MSRRREAVPWHRPCLVIWILFDHANGLDGSKKYAFWFETRKKALDYKRWIAEQDKEMYRRLKLRRPSTPHVTGPFKYLYARPDRGSPGRQWVGNFNHPIGLMQDP